MALVRTLSVAFLVSCALFLGCPISPSGNGNTNNNDNNDNNGDLPSVEFGFTDDNGVFTAVGDDEVMPLFTSGQGGSHFFVTLRTTHFPLEDNGDALISMDENVTLESDGRVLHNLEQVVRFVPGANGVAEVQSRFVFLDALPNELDGQTAAIDFVLTSAEDPQASVRVTQSVVMQLQ
jgi:hypothetical protein